MLLAQWIFSSDAVFAAAIVAFLLLLAVDLLSAPACLSAEERSDAGEPGPAASDHAVRRVLRNR